MCIELLFVYTHSMQWHCSEVDQSEHVINPLFHPEVRSGNHLVL